jgi:predicted nucleic acid-binding protein
MSDRFFLDTNIFVYALSRSVPSKRLTASRLVDEAIESGKGIISFQVVQEFFSVAFRRFTPPMSPTEAEQVLAMTFRPLLAVHSSYSLYGQALELTRRHSISWYDSLIVAAGIESDCRILYTEDLQHDKRFDNLRIQNPFLQP